MRKFFLIKSFLLCSLFMFDSICETGARVDYLSRVSKLGVIISSEHLVDDGFSVKYSVSECLKPENVNAFKAFEEKVWSSRKINESYSDSVRAVETPSPAGSLDNDLSNRLTALEANASRMNPVIEKLCSVALEFKEKIDLMCKLWKNVFKLINRK